MSARDVPLWRAWRLAHASEYVAFFFDVALGDGTDVGAAATATLRFAFLRLTRFRADAIGARPDGWDIIEVRPAAGAAALGALTTYNALWHEDPPDTRPVRQILVTDRIKPDIARLAGASGIRIDLVEAIPLAGAPG